EELYNSWLELNEDLDFDDLSIDNIGQDVVVEWIENSKNFTEDLFRKAEIEPIEHVDYKKEGYYVVAEFIKSTVS
ncbi:MAG: hypothetical protein SVR94_14760, partial [Pseudomonadota bacterium]|nr:hypothetical protein [Pseudomonadota bacterium]